MAAPSRRSTAKKTPKASPKPDAETRSGTSNEFPGDEEWNRMIALFRESGSAGSARMDKLRASAIAVAAIYELHDADWPRYLAERHVKAGKRGPTAMSEFHSLFKLGLSIDAGGDKAGMASMLSHVIDEWVETARNRSAADGGPVSAAEIDGWIGDRKLQEVAKLHRDRHSDRPSKEEKADAFHDLLDLEPLYEMPLPDALAGHGWVRPLFRVVDDRLQLIDCGQTVSQVWLEGNAAAIIEARGLPVEKATEREVVDAGVTEAPVESRKDDVEYGETRTADGGLLTLHGVVDRHRARSETEGPMLIRDHLDRDCKGKDAQYRSKGTNEKFYRSISRLLKGGGRYAHLVGSVYVLAKRGAAETVPSAVPDVVPAVKEQFATVAAMAASALPPVEDVQAEAASEAVRPSGAATENQYPCHSVRGSCHYSGCAAAGHCVAPQPEAPPVEAAAPVEQTTHGEDEDDDATPEPEVRKIAASIRRDGTEGLAMLAEHREHHVKQTRKAIRLTEQLDSRIENGTLQRDHVKYNGGEFAILAGTDSDWLIRFHGDDLIFHSMRDGGVQIDKDNRNVMVGPIMIEMTDGDFKSFNRSWRKYQSQLSA
jgi:hypothetical protein